LARKPTPWFRIGSSPLPDSYGRVTNPERYAVLHEETRSLIESLVSTYNVISEPGNVGIDFPDWKGSTGDAIRLHPTQGTPVVFLFTDFPGILIRFGEWNTEAFPNCGCDACDEKPDDVIFRMRTMIELVVAGGYQEVLTKRSLRQSFDWPQGLSVTERRISRAERSGLGQPGSHKWPPWPRR
jgi:Family of unknown function (DUF6226)